MIDMKRFRRMRESSVVLQKLELSRGAGREYSYRANKQAKNITEKKIVAARIENKKRDIEPLSLHAYAEPEQELNRIEGYCDLLLSKNLDAHLFCPCIKFSGIEKNKDVEMKKKRLDVVTLVFLAHKQLELPTGPKSQTLYYDELKLHGYQLLGTLFLQVQGKEKHRKYHKTWNFNYQNKFLAGLRRLEYVYSS
ncbi:unnamed protein product [Microthlaspi erraticum]|uniref:Uncharacterized protein n=1 Tax=Microthlaspi erraticum TaxID=1685480 RepID=A0A6D2I257_9BRAS|nr:unnamed protein product [Microthlaspi erraticum]